MRRQLTWLRNGALLGIIPFALIYAVPYMFGVAPNQAMNLAVLSLPLIPLTWAYAILRYRLMDVDVIFQQGYAYTLATLCVLAIFYGMIFSVSGAVELNGPAMVAMILIAAFVFQPIRKWVQEQLDRYLLQGPLRLPPHADRVRARAGFAHGLARDARNAFPTG